MNIKRLKAIKRYKNEVEKHEDYEFIKAYFKNDTLPNGKVVDKQPYMQIRHRYCGGIYEVSSNDFINRNVRCTNC